MVTGAMTHTAQFLLSAILALLPTLHPQASPQALLLMPSHGHGKARPQHSLTSPLRPSPVSLLSEGGWRKKANTSGPHSSAASVQNS